MNKPIGFFDSGVGGTSIWKEVHDLLPMESSVYIADSINAPYGEKSKERIIEMCIACTEKLLDLNCKLIVVACNTATTNAISTLRKNFTVPFIGIEPAIKPALLNTKSNCIGVLATKGTLSSELFESTKNRFGEDIEVIEQVGTGLVDFIENGELHSAQLKNLLIQYTQPMIDKKIDYLVLGCSHYPYLKPILETILPPEIQIIDSGEAVAKQTKTILSENQLLSDSSNSSHQFFSTKNTDVLQSIIGNPAFSYQEISL